MVFRYLLDITAAAQKATDERPLDIGGGVNPLEYVRFALEGMMTVLPFAIFFYLSLRLINYLNASRPDPQPSGTPISPYAALGLAEGAGRDGEDLMADVDALGQQFDGSVLIRID